MGQASSQPRRMLAAAVTSVLAACTYEPGPDPTFEGAGAETTADAGAACEGLAGNYAFDIDFGSLLETPVSMSLFEDQGDCKARLTTPWLPSVLWNAVVSDTEVVIGEKLQGVLSRLLVGSYQSSGMFRELVILQLNIPRDGSGAFTGPAIAAATFRYHSDDAGTDSDEHLEFFVRVDDQSPQLRAGGRGLLAPQPGVMRSVSGPARPMMPPAILPWEPVAVEATEPVPGLASHLAVDSESGATAFEVPSVPSALASTDVWAWAYFPDWDRVRGNTYPIHVGDGLTDLQGNPLASVDLSVSVLDPGTPLESHEMDSLDQLAVFGDASVADGKITTVSPCGWSVGGVAGRLKTEGKTAVHFTLGYDGIFGTLVVEVIGRSGKVYFGESVQNGPLGAVAISNEPEVGFRISAHTFCHWTQSVALTVDRVWAE